MAAFCRTIQTHHPQRIDQFSLRALRLCATNWNIRANIKYLPYAFTEHGAIMAANVLNSPRAVQMSVFVVRAFVRMRAALGDTRELARKLAALERELKGRLDVHESAIVGILQRVMDILDPPRLPRPRRREIGFRVEEAGAGYPIRRGGRSR